MGRPRKWASDAERKAASRSPNTPKQAVNGQSKRTQTDIPSKRTGITWHSEIDQARFIGHGRGVPVDGYVLISLGAVPEGQPESGVVSHEDWTNRLDHVCAHSLAGWSCKLCL